MTAGWYVDPFSRFEGRYFDGEKWTERVSHNGSLAIDGGWASFIETYQGQEAHKLGAGHQNVSKHTQESSDGTALSGTDVAGGADVVGGVTSGAAAAGAASAAAEIPDFDSEQVSQHQIDDLAATLQADLDARLGVAEPANSTESLTGSLEADTQEISQSAALSRYSTDTDFATQGVSATQTSETMADVTTAKHSVGDVTTAKHSVGDGSERMERSDVVSSTRRMGLILAALALVAVLASFLLWSLARSKNADQAQDTQTASVEVQTPTTKDSDTKDSDTKDGAETAPKETGDSTSQGDTDTSQDATDTSGETPADKETGSSEISTKKADSGSENPTVGTEPKVGSVINSDGSRTIGETTLFNADPLLEALEKWSADTSELTKVDDGWGCWIQQKELIDFAYCGPYVAADGVHVVDVVPLNANQDEGGISLQSNAGAALRGTQEFPAGHYFSHGGRELTVDEGGSRVVLQSGAASGSTGTTSDTKDSSDSDSTSQDGEQPRGARGERGSRDTSGD